MAIDKFGGDGKKGEVIDWNKVRRERGRPEVFSKEDEERQLPTDVSAIPKPTEAEPASTETPTQSLDELAKEADAIVSETDMWDKNTVERIKKDMFGQGWDLQEFTLQLRKIAADPFKTRSITSRAIALGFLELKKKHDI